MFWFKDEITRRKEKEEYEKLMEEVKNKEKPTFKDLVAIMLAQYAIILPMVFGGLIIFAIILYILMAWFKSSSIFKISRSCLHARNYKPSTQ